MLECFQGVIMGDCQESLLSFFDKIRFGMFSEENPKIILSVAVISIGNIAQRKLICDGFYDNYTTKSTAEIFPDGCIRMDINDWLQWSIFFDVESILGNEVVIMDMS